MKASQAGRSELLHFQNTLEEGDTALTAACKDAAVIQIVNYESLFKSPNGGEPKRVNELTLPSSEWDTFPIGFNCYQVYLIPQRKHKQREHKRELQWGGGEQSWDKWINV